MNPMTDAHDLRNFRARALPVHLYSGEGALRSLPGELTRAGVQRAVILCGRSVHERTDLTASLAGLIGPRLAGVFPGIAEGAPTASIEAAARYAAGLNADGLIAVGAGSVLKGSRVVAMLLGEGGDLESMATRYDHAGRAVATRLARPKPPLFNVLTAPTTAQNRAGSALRHSGDRHQLEFFDPKTRPRAIFWDPQALGTAPASLLASTGLEVYFLALMGTGSAAGANALVAPSRAQAWTLARQSMERLREPGMHMDARLDLCAAAYLQNRDEDDGGQPLKTHLAARAAYALSVAVFNRVPGVTQSHGYAAFTGACIRAFGDLCLPAVRAMGDALGVDGGTLPPQAVVEQVAAAADAAFARLGWDREIRWSPQQGNSPQELVHFALRNYNANSDGVLTPHSGRLLHALEAVARMETVGQ